MGERGEDELTPLLVTHVQLIKPQALGDECQSPPFSSLLMGGLQTFVLVYIPDFNAIKNGLCIWKTQLASG